MLKLFYKHFMIAISRHNQKLFKITELVTSVIYKIYVNKP